MSGIDAVLYEYVKFIHVIYGSFSVFRLQPLYAFLSIYAYSLINLQARRTLFDSAWYRVGLGGRCKPGMALTAIGEAVPQ